jgi:hypothetical protein
MRLTWFTLQWNWRANLPMPILRVPGSNAANTLAMPNMTRGTVLICPPRRRTAASRLVKL